VVGGWLQRAANPLGATNPVRRDFRIEFHRLAYNAAFRAADLTIDGEPVVWTVEYYGQFRAFLFG
jgi:hypothetical protein